MQKIKDFFIKYKKQILKILLYIGIAIAVSLLAFLILYLTKVVYFNNGLHFNEELFKKITDNPFGYLIFFLIQVVITVFLCFVPATTTTFIALAIVIYGANVKTYFLLLAGVVASSISMDLLGRFGGIKIIKKLFGEEDYNKAKDYIKLKSSVYLPIMYLFPLFPDDLLCCLAGMSKINIFYHFGIILLCRGIGVATIVFGIKIIPFDKFITWYHWALAILLIAIVVVGVFVLARLIDKKITKKIKEEQ